MAEGKTGWVHVSPEVAKRHPLYGAQGWLYVVMLGCVVAPVRIIWMLFPVYSSIDFSVLHPLFTTFIFVEIGINALVVLWSLANLWLLASVNRWFPTSFVTIAAFSVAFLTVDAVAVKFIMDATGQAMSWSDAFDAETAREIGRTVVYASVWIPYMFISRRVNVTYRHRVRADDPLAAAA